MPRYKRVKPTYEQIVADFVKGCGLRTNELERLRVCDFYRQKRAFVYALQRIHVAAHDESPAHEVFMLPMYDWTIDRLCQGRAPDDLVFETLPALDYDALREEYIRAHLGTMNPIRVLAELQLIRETGGKCPTK